jgi:acyl-CoA thioester hydrolase
MSERRQPPSRRELYRWFTSITTRWIDNDAYGHLNNVVYYSYFDTAVNQMLIERGLLDIARSPVVGLVVETQCRYFAPIAFPATIAAGLRVARLGHSSVRYEIGIFKEPEQTASAEGHFVHVYVDRERGSPVAIPTATRVQLATLAGPVSDAAG